MTARAITIVTEDLTGATLEGAEVQINLQETGISTTGLVLEGDLSAVTGENGRAVVQLWENSGSFAETEYRIKITHPGTGKKVLDRTFTVYDNDALLHDLLPIQSSAAPSAVDAALAKITQDRAAVSSDKTAISGWRDALLILKGEVENSANDASTAATASSDSKDAAAQSASETATVKGQVQTLKSEVQLIIDQFGGIDNAQVTAQGMLEVHTSAGWIEVGNVVGPTADYDWSGTSIRFKHPNGTWGDYVDLVGLKGDPGLSPGHQWAGTSLQLQLPSGGMGALVDLKGEIGNAPAHQIDDEKIRFQNANGSWGPWVSAVLKQTIEVGAPAEYEWAGTSVRFKDEAGGWGIFVDLKGIKGDTGDKPAHDWDLTSLRFRDPNGDWGNSVNLKGDAGHTPSHEWQGTSVRFQKVNLTWGDLIDLKGDQGDAPAHRVIAGKLQFQNPNGTWGDEIDILSESHIQGAVIDNDNPSLTKTYASQKILDEIKKSSSISISGPSELVATTSATYTILSPDSFTDYSVSVDVGLVSIAGNTITLTAPATPGTIVMTITAGESSRALTIQALPDTPAAPLISLPVTSYHKLRSNVDIAIALGAFSMLQGSSDTHASTDYQIWTGPGGTGTKLTESLAASVDKTSHTFSGAARLAGQSYYVRARFISAIGGAGEWGESSFAMDSVLVPTVPGTPYGGGYYVGEMIYVPTTARYALIIAPKSAETTAAWTSQNISSLVTSRFDGYKNTYITIPQSTAYPAANYARTLSLGGHTDWFLGAFYEHEVTYRNLKPSTQGHTMSAAEYTYSIYGISKGENPYSDNGAAYTVGNPTQTTSPLFQTGGSQELGYVWTSSVEGGWDPFYFWYGTAESAHISKASGWLSVRPYRRVRIG